MRRQIKATNLRAMKPLLVNPESLFLSRSGKVIGEISISLNGQYFPEEHWSDFPVILLHMWASSVLNVWNGASEARCRFMDGPFWFDLMALKSSWIVRCTDGHSPSVSGPTEEFEPRAVMSNITYCAEQILLTCKKKQWGNTDSRDLEATVARLRIAIASRE